ncbi:hypothetical protein [Actinomyces ruminicola]|uniref:hypothetical protein n=1 Tax=Actinomyces ruminicola TaxID=332524 RepID=UPI0011C6EFE8|nr:hypothetical protein [Actinomyces ruminicola]
MNRSLRSELKAAVRTVRSSREEEGMQDWMPRTEERPRESLEQVEAVLLRLRGLLQKEGRELVGDVERDAAVVLAARRQGHAVDLVIGRERAPYSGEAGFLSWIEHNGEVAVTTAPVRQLYEEVARW